MCLLVGGRPHSSSEEGRSLGKRFGVEALPAEAERIVIARLNPCQCSSDRYQLDLEVMSVQEKSLIESINQTLSHTKLRSKSTALVDEGEEFQRDDLLGLALTWEDRFALADQLYSRRGQQEWKMIWERVGLLEAKESTESGETKDGGDEAKWPDIYRRWSEEPKRHLILLIEAHEAHTLSNGHRLRLVKVRDVIGALSTQGSAEQSR